MFWQVNFDHNPALSKLADRILHTLANSVPCERNFSSLNVLHSKLRNALTVERVDKLLYIQINRRTLRGEGLYRVLEDEDIEDEDIEDEDIEDEDIEDEIMEDAGEDTTFIGPAHTTEAEQGEDAPVEVSDDELV
jgi:hAT family C-terminal dimerisation region